MVDFQFEYCRALQMAKAGDFRSYIFEEILLEFWFILPWHFITLMQIHKIPKKKVALYFSFMLTS